MMITIHLLRSSSEATPQGSLVLTTLEQYPTIRRQICDAMEQKQDAAVFVLTRVCDDWFWDLSDYHRDVLLVNDSPVERLKRKLSVDSLPSDLLERPELILGLGLLSLPDPQEEVADVWKWIIQHKLGSLWAIEEPSLDHFSQLVNWYIEKNADPLLQNRVNQLAKLWIQSASGKLKSAYARFFEAPNKNAYLLIAARSLAIYDRKLSEQWLAAEGWYSPEMEDIVDIIDPPKKIPALIHRKLNPKILTHWNTRLKEL